MFLLLKLASLFQIKINKTIFRSYNYIYKITIKIYIMLFILFAKVNLNSVFKFFILYYFKWINNLITNILIILKLLQISIVF